MNTDSLKGLARDLAREYPRSPRDTLAGYVIAARSLDKCRASLAGTLGDYRWPSYIDRLFFEFAGIGAEAFSAVVATGASDEQVAVWIGQQAAPRPRIDVIKWNNRQRETRLSELPDKNQEFMEDYIPKFTPKNRPVYCWFDVYDLEEKRL